MAPSAGVITVTFTKIYYSTSATPGAGTATIDLPAGATSLYNLSSAGGNLGAETYATTLVARRAFSISAGGTINITTSGGNGAGLISSTLLAVWKPAY